MQLICRKKQLACCPLRDKAREDACIEFADRNRKGGPGEICPCPVCKSTETPLPKVRSYHEPVLRWRTNVSCQSLCRYCVPQQNESGKVRWRLLLRLGGMSTQGLNEGREFDKPVSQAITREQVGMQSQPRSQRFGRSLQPMLWAKLASELLDCCTLHACVLQISGSLKETTPQRRSSRKSLLSSAQSQPLSCMNGTWGPPSTEA